jgi:hypothetical protein
MSDADRPRADPTEAARETHNVSVPRSRSPSRAPMGQLIFVMTRSFPTRTGTASSR